MAPGDSKPSRQASDLPKAGEVVSGKYRIEQLLAEGGMGVVYEATHLQLDEKVAIKFLRPELIGPQAGELPGRFLREARTSSKIKSEHVVRVHDVGSLDTGGPYIVMELLKGEDLDQIVSHRGVLPIPQAVDFVLQACEALAEAHDLGIVHRDLKPANLFLIHRADGSPCVKVLDFGISKFTEGPGNTRDFGMTKTHAVMGSPSYMSPEQMRSSKDVDARADIWAIGIILYELLAGTVPFDGDSMPQICAAIIEDTPKNLRVMRPEISAELDSIVTKCLAKKVEDRFANVAVLAQALSPWGSNEAWASADRIARVLRLSGCDAADAVPQRALTRPISASPPAASPPSPQITRAYDFASTRDSSGIEIAWTDIDVLTPRTKRRRRTIAAAIAACALTAGAGAGAALVVTHRQHLPVETTAAVLHTEAPAEPLRRTSSSALLETSPVARAVTDTIPPAVVGAQRASSEPTAASAPTVKATSKTTPTKHASHGSHVASAAAESPQTVSPSDMWSGRK